MAEDKDAILPDWDDKGSKEVILNAFNKLDIWYENEMKIQNKHFDRLADDDKMIVAALYQYEP